MAKKPKTPKDGLYRSVPMSEYETWEAINHSILHILEKTPMHARYAKTVPREPTPALEMGDAFHAAVLEPERFEAEYAEAPCIGRKTKKDINLAKAFCSRFCGNQMWCGLAGSKSAVVVL